MIAAVLALSMPALADSYVATEADIACFPPELTDHRPVAEQDGVPVDAQLYLVFAADGCINGVEVTLSTGGETLWTESAQIDHSSGLVEIDPGTLLPETEYELFAVALGYSESDGDSFRFTTGTDASQVVVDPPELTLHGVGGESYPDSDWASYEADFHVSAVPVKSGISYVEILQVDEQDRVIQTAFVPETGELELAARWGGVIREEVCLAAIQVDASGARTDLGAASCVDTELTTESPEGQSPWIACSTAGRGTAGLGLALVALVGLVRRRETRA